MDLALTVNCWVDEDLMFAQQLGVNHVVAESARPGPGEGPWDARLLKALRNRVMQAGLTLAGLDRLPCPLDRAILGADGRDREIEAACQFIRDAAAAGIPLVAYEWAADLSEGSTAGALTAATWATLGYFLERVLPVADQAGVSLAGRLVVPTAVAQRGAARSLGGIAGFRHWVDRLPSPRNGLDLNPGMMSLASSNDLAEDVSWLFAQKRVLIATLSNLRPREPNACEEGPGSGELDTLGMLRRFRELGYDGLVRPGSQPAIVSDSAWGHKAQAFAVGYLRAFLQVVEGKPSRAACGGNGSR